MHPLFSHLQKCVVSFGVCLVSSLCWACHCQAPDLMCLLVNMVYTTQCLVWLQDAECVDLTMQDEYKWILANVTVGAPPKPTQ